MAGPKMGNSYPSVISSYPNWVAHETPYTAEWGNSVGYEFYLVEYELGPHIRKGYNNLADRLDALEADLQTAYHSFSVPFVTQNKGAGQVAADPLGAEVDAPGDFGNTSFAVKSTREGYWTVRIWGISKVVEADNMMLRIKLEGGVSSGSRVGSFNRDETIASETDSIAINDVVEWKLEGATLNNLGHARLIGVEVIHAAAAGDDCATNVYISAIEIYNSQGIE